MKTTVLAVFLLSFSLAALGQQSIAADNTSRQDAVVRRGDHVMGFSHDATTHHFHLLQVSRDKISVEMRQENVLDLKPMVPGKRQILVGVPLRINDGWGA